MKKKIILVILMISLVITACGKKTERKKELKIGILQYIEHLALDDTRDGFLEQLKEDNIDAEIIEQNAQGDISTARTIAENFVSEDVDLIFAIGTPRAEAAKSVTKDIPILFSAVTDPVGSGLLDSMDKPEGNITGTIDASDINQQLQLFNQIDEKIKNIGVIYSQDEANSLSQLEDTKKEAEELGFNIHERSIHSISDLPQAAQSLVKEIDGLYILSDNKIASSISLLADILVKNKISSVCVEESQVKGGGLITIGLTYHDLGKQTGKMAKRILVDKEKIENIGVEKAEKIVKYVNEETLEALGMKKTDEIFKDAEFVRK